MVDLIGRRHAVLRTGHTDTISVKRHLAVCQCRIEITVRIGEGRAEIKREGIDAGPCFFDRAGTRCAGQTGDMRHRFAFVGGIIVAAVGIHFERAVLAVDFNVIAVGIGLHVVSVGKAFAGVAEGHVDDTVVGSRAGICGGGFIDAVTFTGQDVAAGDLADFNDIAIIAGKRVNVDHGLHGVAGAILVRTLGRGRGDRQIEIIAGAVR